MLDCLILGDSIAVGTHQFRPECVSYSKGGINSWQWNKKFLEGDQGNNLKAKTIIISLGSNDHKGVKTRAELERMRKSILADRVFWILPAGNLKASGVDIEMIQAFVKVVAAEHGDIVLPILRLQSDGIHPSTAGYKNIAESTR
jgi:lysophospholipase L1-like esterase